MIRANPRVDVVRANLGVIVVIVIIGAALSLLSPMFLGSLNLRTVLLRITTNMYTASGLSLVMPPGGIDLSVGSIIGMSGTLVAGFMAFNHPPLWLAAAPPWRSAD